MNKILLRFSICLLTFFCLACSTTKKQEIAEKAFPLKERLQARENEKEAENERVFRVIDSLLIKLWDTPYDDHIYNVSNPYFDELRYFHHASLDYERYIFKKVLRPKTFLKGDAKSWADALKLLPKKDCKDGDMEHRFYTLLSVIRDTTSISRSVDNMTKISAVLREPCARTLNYLQTQTEWRAEMFSALLIQLEAFDNSKEPYVEEYYEDIYEIMYELPDSLTSNYAYTYLMENDDLPEYLQDIIDKRFKNWDTSWSFNNYSGSSILFSEQQVREMIARAEEIQAKGNCDWCKTFMYRLNTRFR